MFASHVSNVGRFQEGQKHFPPNYSVKVVECLAAPKVQIRSQTSFTAGWCDLYLLWVCLHTAAPGSLRWASPPTAWRTASDPAPPQRTPGEPGTQRDGHFTSQADQHLGIIFLRRGCEEKLLNTSFNLQPIEAQ